MQMISVEVRKSQHKYIVGPRGLVLQEILHTTGVWVEVPGTDSDSATITLRGPQEKLGQALTQVWLICTCRTYLHACTGMHSHISHFTYPVYS